MQVQNYYVAVSALLALLGTNSHAQLISTDPDVSDGVCNFPSKMALNTKVLDVRNKFQYYKIPAKS